MKELGYGNAVHHVLRRIAEHTRAAGQVPGFSEIQGLFHREFYLPLADKPAWDSMQLRAQDLVANYLNDHPEDLQRVWEVERPFELHLEHANVVGRADVILDREGGVEGALAIVDYKTRRADDDPKMGLQLQVYTAAGRGRASTCAPRGCMTSPRGATPRGSPWAQRRPRWRPRRRPSMNGRRAFARGASTPALGTTARSAMCARSVGTARGED